jgi:hypothetical protein
MFKAGHVFTCVMISVSRSRLDLLYQVRGHGRGAALCLGDADVLDRDNMLSIGRRSVLTSEVLIFITIIRKFGIRRYKVQRHNFDTRKQRVDEAKPTRFLHFT